MTIPSAACDAGLRRKNKGTTFRPRLVNTPCAGILLVFLLLVIPPASVQADSDWDARALARALNPPLGLPPVTAEEKALLNRDLIQLGRRLFFDPRLSHKGDMSCATCHQSDQAYTQNALERSVGANGEQIRRNAPTVINAKYYERLFHDGRARSLETQFLSPLLAPEEMNNGTAETVVAKLAAIPRYVKAFRKVFGGAPDIGRLGTALGAFQRTLISGNSRFDRWKFGSDPKALTAEEKAGFVLFTGQASCASCHQIGEDQALFTDQTTHDIGTTRRKAKKTADLGQFEVTGVALDKGRFRTPGLRNVALTAPYMHDGSMASLEEVIQFYNKGGVAGANLDVRIRTLNLTDRQVAQLVAFLNTLTGDNIDELREADSLP